MYANEQFIPPLVIFVKAEINQINQILVLNGHEHGKALAVTKANEGIKRDIFLARFKRIGSMYTHQ
jgi:hypothetical protein